MFFDSMISYSYSSKEYNKTETINDKKDNNIKPDEKMTNDEKADAKNIAQRRVKLGLLMGDIGRNNNIDVSEEEIKQAVMMDAQKYPGQEKQVLEDYEKNMNYKTYMNLVYPSNQHGFTIIPNLGHTTNTYSSNIFKQYLVSVFN